MKKGTLKRANDILAKHSLSQVLLTTDGHIWQPAAINMALNHSERNSTKLYIFAGGEEGDEIPIKDVTSEKLQKIKEGKLAVSGIVKIKETDEETPAPETNSKAGNNSNPDYSELDYQILKTAAIERGIGESRPKKTECIDFLTKKGVDVFELCKNPDAFKLAAGSGEGSGEGAGEGSGEGSGEGTGEGSGEGTGEGSGEGNE